VSDRKLHEELKVRMDATQILVERPPKRPGTRRCTVCPGP